MEPTKDPAAIAEPPSSTRHDTTRHDAAAHQQPAHYGNLLLNKSLSYTCLITDCINAKHTVAQLVLVLSVLLTYTMATCRILRLTTSAHYI